MFHIFCLLFRLLDSIFYFGDLNVVIIIIKISLQILALCCWVFYLIFYILKIIVILFSSSRIFITHLLRSKLFHVSFEFGIMIFFPLVLCIFGCNLSILYVFFAWGQLLKFIFLIKRKLFYEFHSFLMLYSKFCILILPILNIKIRILGYRHKNLVFSEGLPVICALRTSRLSLNLFYSLFYNSISLVLLFIHFLSWISILFILNFRLRLITFYVLKHWVNLFMNFVYILHF